MFQDSLHPVGHSFIHTDTNPSPKLLARRKPYYKLLRDEPTPPRFHPVFQFLFGSKRHNTPRNAHAEKRLHTSLKNNSQELFSPHRHIFPSHLANKKPAAEREMMPVTRKVASVNQVDFAFHLPLFSKILDIRISREIVVG